VVSLLEKYHTAILGIATSKQCLDKGRRVGNPSFGAKIYLYRREVLPGDTLGNKISIPCIGISFIPRFPISELYYVIQTELSPT